ncbi:Uncharacterised protein [Serratia plymuthica]|uniref:Uncharacterized protein n=1 Tax=Serratia plymuthica TaxID=82996 RepID=A0A2X4VE75_SERPL|nr:Uncharacterised protein [Serratia plymuthica]
MAKAAQGGTGAGVGGVFFGLLLRQQSLGGTPDDTGSAFTHSAYILIYLALLVTLLAGPRRNFLLCAVIAGIVLLCAYLAISDYHAIYTLRETSALNPARVM